MFPPDVTAAEADAILEEMLLNLRLLSTYGWSLVIGLGVYVWFLLVRLEKGCPSCAHCQSKAKGDPSVRERLFGREVQTGESPEESSSGEGAPDDSDGPASEPVQK